METEINEPVVPVEGQTGVVERVEQVVPSTTQAPKTSSFAKMAQEFAEKGEAETVSTEVPKEIEGGEKGAKAEEKKELDDPLGLLTDEPKSKEEFEEATTVGVKDEKGQYVEKPINDLLKDATFTLKHNKKLVQVEGYDKLISLAQQGFNATQINTEAKRIQGESQRLYAAFNQQVEAKATELAQKMYREAVEANFPTATDPTGANVPIQMLQKQLDDMKAQLQAKTLQEEKQRLEQTQLQNQQMAAQKANEIGNGVVEPFKPYFKDQTGKFDEPTYNRFLRTVKIETREALERIATEQGREPIFQPEEIQEIMGQTARQVYKDQMALAERIYQSKVAVKKKSTVPPLTPGGAGNETTASGNGNSSKRISFQDIKAGKY